MIKANSHILANGNHYEAGQIIEGLNDAQEKQLVNSGAASFDMTNAQENAPTSAPAKLAPKTKEAKTTKENKEAKTDPKAPKTDGPSILWAKTRLLGYARNIGLTVDDTATREELLAAIKAAPADAKPPVDDSNTVINTPSVTVLPGNAPTFVPEAPKLPGEAE